MIRIVSPSSSLIRIATRKSPLAMAQAYQVASSLQALSPDLRVEFIPLITEGDALLSMPLVEMGGKGLFVKALEQALLENQADIAVHSMKDMTIHYPAGLVVPVICERADPRDTLISLRGDFAALPVGAKVGTASLRRQCQLLAQRPDLTMVTLRGNVNTRLHKLDEGLFDAVVLASAGLARLHITDRVMHTLPIELCLPAVGQGAIGIQCREQDTFVRELIAPLNDVATFQAVQAERAFNARLNGGCRAPIAAYAQVKAGQIDLRGLVGRPDGALILQAQQIGAACEAVQLGEALAETLLNQGAAAIIQAL